MAELKTPEEIEAMAEAGQRLAEILERLKNEVKAGIATIFFDKLARRLIQEARALPAFLGYQQTASSKPYPAALCVSVNDTVVHGRPSGCILKEGDVVKLDLGLKYKGFYVDAAVTVAAGAASTEAKNLISATKEALNAAIKKATAGNTIGDIGNAIQTSVSQNGFRVAQSLTGHAIGRKLHEDPAVPNTGQPGGGENLEVGMVLAIEPMVVVGSGKVKQLPDDSFVTADGSLAAHFEHTVAITEKGSIVLTKL
jgi:methionyl aminopeptidase